MSTKTPRERFEDLVKKLYPEICMIKNGFLEHEWKYKEPDSLWSFIETLLEEARQEEREKLATFIRENRNTVTLVQIEDFISSLIHYGNIGL